MGYHGLGNNFHDTECRRNLEIYVLYIFHVRQLLTVMSVPDDTHQLLTKTDHKSPHLSHIVLNCAFVARAQSLSLEFHHELYQQISAQSQRSQQCDSYHQPRDSAIKRPFFSGAATFVALCCTFLRQYVPPSSFFPPLRPAGIGRHATIAKLYPEEAKP